MGGGLTMRKGSVKKETQAGVSRWGGRGGRDAPPIIEKYRIKKIIHHFVFLGKNPFPIHF